MPVITPTVAKFSAPNQTQRFGSLYLGGVASGCSRQRIQRLFLSLCKGFVIPSTWRTPGIGRIPLRSNLSGNIMWQNHVPAANGCEHANQSLSAAAEGVDLEELLFMNTYKKQVKDRSCSMRVSIVPLFCVRCVFTDFSVWIHNYALDTLVSTPSIQLATHLETFKCCLVWHTSSLVTPKSLPSSQAFSSKEIKIATIFWTWQRNSTI